ncbi:MAG: tetratricopeptide repeat protein [Candidatus Schekmanbacteria bacterium]|nr:tetratricopeptide repeat protein [Candidatus Schekmanbacteria bacterium]
MSPGIKKTLLHESWKYLLLVILAAAVYGGTLNYPFQYDDWGSIINNRSITSMAHPEEIFSFDPTRPVVNLSYAVNYFIGATDPALYRTFNIIVHVLNSALLYILFVNIAEAEGYAISRNALFFCASIFLVQPVQIESVTYVSSRSELLSFLFVTASWILFLKAENEKLKIPLYAVSLFFFLMALFSKERAVVFPIILLAYIWVFRTGKAGMVKRSLLSLAPFVAVTLAYSFYRLKFASSAEEQKSMMREPLEQASGMLESMRTYLRLLFFPVNQNIDHTIGTPHGFALAAEITVLAVVISFLIWLIKKRYDHPFILFGSMMFIIPLLPNIIIPLKDIMSERWLYMSVSGVSFAVIEVAILRTKLQRGVFMKCILYAGIAVIILFAALAAKRNMVWASEISLWEDAAKKSPLKARPRNNLGYCYGKAGDIFKAREELQYALKLDPGYALSYFNLGLLDASEGHMDDALNNYIKAYDMGNTMKENLFNIGMIYARKGQYDMAEKWLRRVLDGNPDYEPALENLAELLYHSKRNDEAVRITGKLEGLGIFSVELERKKGDVFFAAGKNATAREIYLSCLKKDPGDIGSLLGLANTYQVDGDPESLNKALGIYREALGINKNIYEAYGNMALVLLKMGNRDEAVTSLQKLLSIKPDDSRAASVLKSIQSGSSKK